MNKNIKTRKEIILSYGAGKDLEDSWVSLSWLRHQIIKREGDHIDESGQFVLGYGRALDWVLSLLEDKK